ncbi:MAG: K(+)-stimulated pyrophosphate-energized sodium pump [Myxococcota bacterium]|jgi:K(+)-stimulated pyrophosphate-energized sodium pump
MKPIFVVTACGVAALAYAYVKSMWVNKQDGGTDKMKEIGGHIRDGAMAFLAQEYKVLTAFVIVVTGLLAWANAGSASSDVLVALSFVIGAICSGLAGFFGMRVATAANFRTTAAARTGLAPALGIAFTGGAVMGMSVVGLATVGLSSLYVVFTGMFEWTADAGFGKALAVLSGFSLGASSIALFARVGGGIYTKAADVGADLVGKVEAGIPEDDPRNPATIADNVGDNVGDVAGMGADLFESYVGAIIGSMILAGSLALGAEQMGIEASVGFRNLIELPLMLAGLGIVVSIIGTFFVKVAEGGDPSRALHTGTLLAAALMIAGAWFLIDMFVPKGAVFAFVEGQLDAILLPEEVAREGVRFMSVHLGIFLAMVIGLVAGTAIGLITEYYTSDHKAPVHGIAKAAETGAATVIIAGTAVGMRSVTFPLLILAATIVGAHHVAGLYGIAIAALGMLSTTGIQLAVDAYGPIADNAGGIAEMSKLEPIVRERTDKLDAVGNTTAAIGKGFAIGSAALTALALFASFTKGAHLTSINVMEPKIMAGVFIGGMLPFLFSAMAMEAVGRAAFAMIEEVRRQFREIPGLLEGTATAEYAKCVAISTDSAIKEMVMPGLLAVVTPVVVGIWSLPALGGLLVGVTVTGVTMALYQSNAGGAWDNAKKYIEGGKHGGKGSDAHHAAVVGDTVGDPFKDTSGPSLNILIKLMSVVAVVIAPALYNYHADDAQKAADKAQVSDVHNIFLQQDIEAMDENDSLSLLTVVDAQDEIL